jgi:hypothetical protein
LGDLKSVPKLNAAELPFLKRAPYVDEVEYRAVYVNRNELLGSLDLEIDLNWIKSITLSPWMPIVQKASVVSTLRSIHGCEKLKIVRSTLIENSTWRGIATNARKD